MQEDNQNHVAGLGNVQDAQGRTGALGALEESAEGKEKVSELKAKYEAAVAARENAYGEMVRLTNEAQRAESCFKKAQIEEEVRLSEYAEAVGIPHNRLALWYEEHVELERKYPTCH